MLDIDYKVLRILHRNDPLKVGSIAKKIGLPHSTVGSCIKRLENNGYVVYQRYNPVILTDKGTDLAIELNRHAHLLEMLLINELEIEANDAHAECEKFNLLFSCNVIKKICERYKHPKECSCGEEISNSSDCFCEKEI
ncbi:MAG: metal-dependent transcriptional regulator [Promethearchaeota archaeon]|nr:MAG: metal-dependent transcriptional regulator [Candidatus Lokiarchaeota archaeon]